MDAWFRLRSSRRQWTKLETANATYAEWIAAISGKMGAVTSDGFVLEDANVQVFERKSKATTQTEQVLADSGDHLTDGDGSEVMDKQTTQIKPETVKPQAKSVDAGKSMTSPEEKLASKQKSSSDKSSPQPKKIGKFNVQIR